VATGSVLGLCAVKAEGAVQSSAEPHPGCASAGFALAFIETCIFRESPSPFNRAPTPALPRRGFALGYALAKKRGRVWGWARVGEDTHASIRPRKQFSYRIRSKSPTIELLDCSRRILAA